MTTTYHFYTAGFIPGIPGIFAGVTVEVDDASREILAVTPLGCDISMPAVETSQPLTSPDPLDIPETSKES